MTRAKRKTKPPSREAQLDLFTGKQAQPIQPRLFQDFVKGDKQAVKKASGEVYEPAETVEGAGRWVRTSPTGRVFEAPSLVAKNAFGVAFLLRRNMNLKLFLIIFLCGVLFIFQGVGAGWFFGPSNYNECTLKYIKNTRSGLAVKMIRRACDDKFTPKFLTDENTWSKGMCNCILKNMQGAENDQAARLILRYCKNKTVQFKYPARKYPPINKNNKPEGKKKLIKKNGEYYFIWED